MSSCDILGFIVAVVAGALLSLLPRVLHWICGSSDRKLCDAERDDLASWTSILAAFMLYAVGYAHSSILAATFFPFQVQRISTD
jgi:hypothetical protein